jgi:hypothetical protein
MTIKKIVLLLGFLVQIGFGNISVAQSDASQADVAEHMVGLFFLPRELLDNGFKEVSNNWQRSHTPMAIEMLSLSRTEIGYRFAELLKQKTGQDFGLDTNQWLVWWWQQEPVVDASYAKFKSRLYGLIDEKFKVYFSSERDSRIRLDEVRWGGVKQDGIPPLRQPNMITAAAADYLEDDNVIFGIKINGDARAYPKRILAWHEMFIDEIGGTEFAGVYCTLCGAVILYKTEYEGVRHRLGTSGFLYRSNKLMYDRDTQSLWNTTWGEPVIGPLTANGIQLERSYLVTTTWGEWKRRHPDTTVLSLETGYRRDYGEGVAYHSYFSTDELMFAISTRDNRLKNKDEVLALVFPKHSSKSMAISADYLGKTPIYSNRMDKLAFVVLTDRSGANRVYESGGVSFVDYDRESAVTDNDGRVWNLSEDKLSLDGAELARLPAHRAFWFGWHAAYPDTVLVK